jgi:hypothetical protein
MKTLRYGALAAVLVIAFLTQAQSAKTKVEDHDSARERLIGAWHLVRIAAPAPDGKPLDFGKEKHEGSYTKSVVARRRRAVATAFQSTWSTAAAQSSSTSADSTRITVTPASSQKVIAGAPDRFTGSVRVQSLFDAKEPARSSGGQSCSSPERDLLGTPIRLARF